MRKVLLVSLLGVSFGFSLAQAQTWTVEGPFKDEFLGCTRTGGGQVQCVMKSSYIGSGNTYFGATYYAADSAAYAPDNKRYLGISSSINGRDVSRASVNVSKASPVTVTYTFDYPKNFDTIALLFMDTGMMKNVPIKAAAAAAPAQPAATQPAAAQPAPAAASSAPGINLSTFDIKLSDCKQTPQGGFTCAKADLTPKR